MSIHRFLLIESIDTCISILSDAYSYAAHGAPPPASPRRRSRVSPSPAPPATPGRSCCACCRGIPAVALTAAMSSGQAGGSARRLPALARLWDGAIAPLVARDAGARRRRRVPGAARCGRRGARAGAGRRRRPRHRSVRRVPAARRGSERRAGIPKRSGCRRASPTASPSASAARWRARSWSPTRAAIRRRRCSRWRRWRTRACSSPAPTSSSTRSRACRAPARRRRSGRTSPRSTAASRRTACSATATAPRSSRAWDAR